MCRGDFRSSWVAEGGYNLVAEALFGGLEVDGFSLEDDDARSGGFEPLRSVPRGKRVVLGPVTTKRPELESRDDLRRRIDEAARYVPLERLAISPQCGFSSTVEGNALTRDEQVAELALVVAVAQEVWGYAWTRAWEAARAGAGTGSLPPAPGRQRRSRATVSRPPRRSPWFRSASSP
ncbi:Cobalamin-independent synthase, Catalytic domain [Geodermatophilus amargosae]|uniref:Cobalamin-independent synthase, Catalytic domain n=1 Tax=Geodermatophilus amargosae TaxID=1296565 RepID=A0A1I7CT18_9ACTN|nr:Cobalamin-independent synthase, Catalytic domain [Geodermatophilus amargosae]